VSSTPSKSTLVFILSILLWIGFLPAVAVAQTADAADESTSSTTDSSDNDLSLFGEDVGDDDLFGDSADDSEQSDEVAGPEFAVPDDVDVIQVTGQRTDASSQGQSIAISSFNQEALDQLGVSDVSTLQQNVPSLHIGQTGTQGIITLRGVGIENLTISGEQGVLFVQDGVPIGSATAALAAFYDVRALDVFRGPQGTQGGKNVSGGWISVTSAPPQPDFTGFGDYQMGSYDQHIFRGVLNVPIFDEKLMFRFTSRFEDRDGYQRAVGGKVLQPLESLNPQPFNRSEYWGNEHSLNARVQLLSQLTDKFEVHLIGMHTFSENNGPAVHLLSQPGNFTGLGCQVFVNCFPNETDRFAVSTLDPRTSTRNLPGDLKISQWFATAKATYDITSDTLGDLEATAQFGFNRTSTLVTFDFDGTNAQAAVIDLDNGQDQYSFEVKLQTIEQRPWEWLVGFFWWQETKNADQNINFSGTAEGGDSAALTNLETDSIAGFAEVRYWLNDEFHVMLGGRYTQDHKAIQDQPFEISQNQAIAEASFFNSATYSAFTPKLLMQWQWSDSNNISASVTRGYKAGGFPLGEGCIIGDSTTCVPYDSEKVWQYEFTSKNEFLDQRLRLNLTLFWTDYDPYQVCFVAGISFKCFDNGSATTRGVELEWFATPIPELQISGNFNILDARIDNFRIVDPTLSPLFPGSGPPAIPDPLSGFPQDLSGNTIPKAPKYNMTVNAQYDIYLSSLGLPEWGTLTPRVQYNYQSRTYYRVWNEPQTSQGAFSRVDLRLTWRSNSDQWQIEGFINNVTDVDVINSIFLSSGADGTITAQYQMPRMAGLRLKYSFN
jgi:iron complex outermembrane receptor protein